MESLEKNKRTDNSQQLFNVLKQFILNLLCEYKKYKIKKNFNYQ